MQIDPPKSQETEKTQQIPLKAGDYLQATTDQFSTATGQFSEDQHDPTGKYKSLQHTENTTTQQYPYVQQQQQYGELAQNTTTATGGQNGDQLNYNSSGNGQQYEFPVLSTQYQPIYDTQQQQLGYQQQAINTTTTTHTTHNTYGGNDINLDAYKLGQVGGLVPGGGSGTVTLVSNTNGTTTDNYGGGVHGQGTYPGAGGIGNNTTGQTTTAPFSGTGTLIGGGPGVDSGYNIPPYTPQNQYGTGPNTYPGVGGGQGQPPQLQGVPPQYSQQQPNYPLGSNIPSNQNPLNPNTNNTNPQNPINNQQLVYVDPQTGLVTYQGQQQQTYSTVYQSQKHISYSPQVIQRTNGLLVGQPIVKESVQEREQIVTINVPEVLKEIHITVGQEEVERLQYEIQNSELVVNQTEYEIQQLRAKQDSLGPQLMQLENENRSLQQLVNQRLQEIEQWKLRYSQLQSRPKIIEQERIVEQIVEKPVYYDNIIERVVERPAYVENVVCIEVDKPVYVQVEKLIEKQVYIEQIVDQPVEVEVVKYVDNIIEQYVEQPVYYENIIEQVIHRPVIQEQIIQIPVEKPVYIQVDKPIEREVYTEQIVQVPVEYVREVEAPVYVEVDKPVQRQVYIENVIEKPIVTEQQVYHENIVERLIEKPIVMENVIQRQVQVPVYQEREYQVQVQVPVRVDQPYEVQNLIQKPVPFAVEKPVIYENTVHKPVLYETTFEKRPVFEKYAQIDVVPATIKQYSSQPIGYFAGDPSTHTPPRQGFSPGFTQPNPLYNSAYYPSNTVPPYTNPLALSQPPGQYGYPYH